MKKFNLILLVAVLSSLSTFANTVSFSGDTELGAIKRYFTKSRCRRYFRRKSKIMNSVRKSKEYCQNPKVYMAFVDIKLKTTEQQYQEEIYYVSDYSKPKYKNYEGKFVHHKIRKTRTVKVKHSSEQYKYMKFNRCIDTMSKYAKESGEFIINCAEDKNLYQEAVRKGYVQTCFDNAKSRITNDIAMMKCSEKTFRGLIKSSRIYTCIDNLKSLDLKESDSVDFCSDRKRINVSINGEFNSCFEKTKTLSLSTGAHLERCNTYNKIQVVTNYPYVKCVKTLLPYSANTKFNAYESCEDTRYIDRSLREHYPTCIEKLESITSNMIESQSRCATSELYNSTKEVNFIACTQNVKLFNEESNTVYGLCEAKKNINAISSTKYISCAKKMQSVEIENKVLGKECADADFQEDVVNGKMIGCISNINTHTKAPNDSLIACSNVKTKLASTTSSFNKCLAKLEEVDMKKYAINSCTHHHTSFTADNINTLNSCFSRSLESAQGDYFNQTEESKYFNNLEDTTDANNPIAKVLKDCSMDLVGLKSFGNNKIKLIQDFHFSSEHQYRKIKNRVGGLSALSYDPEDSILYAISDGKNNYKEPTIVEYDLTVENEKIKIKESGAITLKVKSGWASDPEGLVRLKDGSFIITTETGLAHENQYINHYSKSGRWQEEIEVPSSYKNRSRKNRGLRNGFQFNKGLEALAISSDEKTLIVANEDTLEQDIGYGYKEQVRLTTFEKTLVKNKDKEDVEKYLPSAQFVYELEDNNGNGLVELLYNDDGTLYALERGYDYSTGVTARLFKISLKNATNVLKHNSLTLVDSPVKKARKELILDFKDIKNSISAGFRKIDNLEGMTFGPTLPNGNKTLIIVSDNNFSTRQFTQFLVFELKN